MSTSLNYRREIDGLRAVAVVPVILCHAGFSVFSGGYVGVDIFFVISGYLITAILINELEQDYFSIVGFYERRARRILPALFVVMFACLPFAYMWMLPSQLEDFAQSLVAIVTFSSNILFWRESGYFSADSDLKPLLHTWSLAVEEQYYLLFPFFLLATWRFGRKRIFWTVITVAAVSLLMAEWGWRNKPSANFYLAPTRAWELFAGSICAFLSVGRTQRSSNGLSAIGLAMIVFSIFAYGANTPVPSVYGLIPVVGTALIILFAAQGTWVARLLSMRAFVGIGLISYSAYLWHQPLFAFARLRSLTEPNEYLMTCLAVAALVLAWATWRFVEQPFRKSKSSLISTRLDVFLVSGTVGALFIAIGLVGHVGKGFEWRFSKELTRFSKKNVDHAKNTNNCILDYRHEISYPNYGCEMASSTGQVDVLLVGDSHNFSISDVLGSALRNVNIGYYNSSYVGCLPLPRMRPFGVVAISNCLDFNKLIFDYALQKEIKTVVLTSRFSWYLHGVQFDNGEGGVEIGIPAWFDVVGVLASDPLDEARRVRVLAAYENRILELAQLFNVVLVYPIPEAGWNVPNRGFRNAYFNDVKATLTTSYAAYKERTKEVNTLFDRLTAESQNVFAARVYEEICSDVTGRCMNADENGIYYHDDNHLSTAGARLVAPVILSAIQKAVRNHETVLGK